MYTLAVPTRDGLDDLDSIVARRHLDVRSLLQPVRPNIGTAYGAYIAHGGNGAFLHPIAVGQQVATALKANYEALDRGRSHQFVRDEIFGSALHGKCPYCNDGPIVTLDHFLPRSVYPEFSALAQNLIPACSTCNTSKGSSCFLRSGFNLFHPYFSHIPNDPILFTEIIVEERGVFFGFFLEQSSTMGSPEFERVENTFVLLGLADRYRQSSVVEMSDRKEHLGILYQTGGCNSVKTYLQNEAESSRKARGSNYWKTAVLQALSDSKAFCDGGFEQL